MLSNSWKRIKSLSCRSHCPTCKSTIKPTDFEPGRNNADEEMDPVDRVLENIVGSHGFWQWFILLIGVIGLPTYEMFSVFGLSEQAYRCRTPDPVESILHNLSVNEAMTILWGMNASDRAQYHMDYPTRCYHRLADLVQMTHSNETNWTVWTPDQLFKLAVGQPVPCENGYVYEPIPNQYPTSVIASFDLTCDRSWLGPLHPTMFMIGMLFGYYLGGWSGDRFGRRPTVLFWFFIFIAAGLLAFYSPNVAFLLLAHLVLGAADSARITVLFVQMFEMTTARWRSVMCSVWTVLQSFGTRAFTSLLAYLLPDWRWLMFAMTAVGSIGVLYICFGPESPRWLVSEGRTDEAVQVLERGYQYNHCCRRSPEGIFTKSDVLALKQMYPMHPVNGEQGNDELSGCGSRLCYVIKSSSIWQMFQSPEHVKRLLLASVIFTCHIYSYYGIMLYGNKIRGVVYVVAVINAASALPGTMMSCILYRVFRWRKRPLLGVFSLAFLSTFTGALCSLTQNHETDLLLIITEGITLTSLEAALDMIYIYIPELFPTMFRSKSLGFCAGCARIGAALCSYTNELDSRLGHGSPMAFYAASILVAILVVLVLPDTSGENLDQCPEQQNEMADF